jgi:hypothetical protein
VKRRASDDIDADMRGIPDRITVWKRLASSR